MNFRFDRRYTMVAAAFVIQAVIIGSMFAYGVFFKTLETELGWSRTLLSASSSLAMIVMGTMAVVGGRLNDRFGPRWVLSATGMSFGIGYALMYFMSSPWQLFVLYGVLIGIGLGTHDVVTLSIVARWFKRRRGMMTGVVKIGTACGQLIVPLVAAMLITAFGWRAACAVLGCGGALLVVIAAQGLRRDPPATVASGSSATPPPATDGEQHGLSLAAAARTPQLWTLCAAQFMFFPSLVTVPVHIAAHGMDMGLAAAPAAALLSTIGGLSIFGRLFIGNTVDRLGGRAAMLICFSVLLASLLWLRFAEAPWMLFVFAACYGFAHGGLFTVVSPTIAEFFGMAAHSSLFGIVVFFGTLGGAIGPLVAGSVFDTTGSYDLAFAGLAALAFTGLLLVTTLRPVPAKPG